MRLFIAVNFPDEVKSTIVEINNSLKDAALYGNFSSIDNLHLTLVFLGECDVLQTEAIKEAMDNTTFPEFSLALDKAGYFKRDGGNIYWIGLKESNSLSRLQADLSENLKQKGFIIENRKFVPHITIGREVKMRDRFVLPEIQQISFKISSIELMVSERVNGRLVYRGWET